MIKYTILLFLLFSFAIKTYTQVTIGSDMEPSKGALLQLKDGTVLGSDPLVNASKGFSLPRVKLLNLKPTNAQELAQSIGNTTGSYDIDAHIGLLVYNSEPPLFNNQTCKWEGQPIGLYLWDGLEWQLMSPKEETTKGTDVRTITDDPISSTLTISYTDPDLSTTETTSYRYSSFGSAGVWMTQNLATKYLPDGTKVTKQLGENLKSPRFITPNNIDENDTRINNTDKYGFLYNWVAAMAGSDCAQIDQGQVPGTIPGANEVEVFSGGSVQGICPKGWHLPSDREWNELEKEITTKMNLYTNPAMSALLWNPDWEYGMSSSPGFGFRGATPDGHGKAMKSQRSVVASLTNGASKNATDGGFDILLVGDALSNVINYGEYGYFWSSSSFDATKAFNRYFSRQLSQVARIYITRGYFFSVRCKKDSE